MEIDTENLDLDERDQAVAVGAVGGGLFAFLVGMLIGSRLLALCGLLTSLGGGALLIVRLAEQREERIEEAHERISSELSDLDPAARAQIIADLQASQPPA